VEEALAWRIQHYALLATLFAKAPDAALLTELANVQIDDAVSPMGEAWLNLTKVSERLSAEVVAEEYHELFIGITQGEMVPYGSYYQSGFLHEKPLAELRNDLAQLGLERQTDTKEPEDHIAAEFDVMRLILSANGTPVVDDKQFFERHIAPWVERFLDDLCSAKHAVFYQAVAALATVFIAQEKYFIK
jgi:TorA maturation chaperone TorD